MKQLCNVKRYSGRPFAADDIDQIRQLIQAHPEANHQRISYLVCEVMDWRKSDGGLKDMSCRVALLRMHREGLIELSLMYSCLVGIGSALHQIGLLFEQSDAFLMLA